MSAGGAEGRKGRPLSPGSSSDGDIPNSLLRLLSLPPALPSSSLMPSHFGDCTKGVYLRSAVQTGSWSPSRGYCLCSGTDQYWLVELSHVTQMWSPLPAVLVDLVQPQGSSSGTGLLPGPVLGVGGQEDLEGGEVGRRCLPLPVLAFPGSLWYCWRWETSG